MKQVKTCFTIVFAEDQYEKAKAYVMDMKNHPRRVYWRGKENKSDEELITEQIAHRIFSNFYNDDPFNAGKHIIKMESTATMDLT